MSHVAVRTVSRRLHALCRRALSTSTDVPPSPHNSPPVSRRDALQKQQDRSARKRPLHPCMIFVRPWDGVPTMAHAFAIVRDIERRFGRIQEFVVLRDPDVLSSCLPFLQATFVRAGDADAIPPDGKIIQVLAPEVDRKRDGGIGLDELHVYLDPDTREKALMEGTSDSDTETEWGPSGQGKLMDVKLERTSSSYLPEVLDQPLGFGHKGPPHMRSRKRTRELAHAIHAFGGFVDQPSHQHDGATRMQTLVSRWSRALEQLPPSPALAPKENVITVEESEEPASSVEEEAAWSPFERDSAAPASSESSSWVSFESRDFTP